MPQTKKLELSQLIKNLRAELAEAKREGDGKDLRFIVEDVELELDIATEASSEGGIAAKFYVFTGQYKETDKDAVTQRIRLKLRPQEEYVDPKTGKKEIGPGKIGGELD